MPRWPRSLKLVNCSRTPRVLIHAVPLLEAQASSEIENIVTTADELFKHLDSGDGDHATKEALRYRRALFV